MRALTGQGEASAAPLAAHEDGTQGLLHPCFRRRLCALYFVVCLFRLTDLKSPGPSSGFLAGEDGILAKGGERLNKAGDGAKLWKEGISDRLDTIRRAFAEFLTVPTAVIIAARFDCVYIVTS